MVTTFCLRLALGMVAPMMILPAAIVPPRFFRVQFLTALGLIVIAGLFVPERLSEGRNEVTWAIMAVAAVTVFAGGIVWHTEEAPGGRPLMLFGTIALAFVLLLTTRPNANASESLPFLIPIDDFASAFMLGSAISAMLMGHSYLIAPAMSLSPLNRLLGLLSVALAFRIGLACWGLSEWTHVSPGRIYDRETALWLGARWLLGLIFPMGLTWMAWESARIRATQSATGILYVVTVLVFLGELISLLLIEKTGFPI